MNYIKTYRLSLYLMSVAMLLLIVSALMWRFQPISSFKLNYQLGSGLLFMGMAIFFVDVLFLLYKYNHMYFGVDETY